MRIPAFLRLKITGPLGALLMTLAGASYLFPTSSIFSTWLGQYPSSATGDAGCQVCHATNSESYVNGYGRAIELQRNAGASTLTAIQNVANLNSDGDAGGATNAAEITAGAQPGWTSGNNTVYAVGGTSTQQQPPPSGVLLDPAPAPPPAAPEINVSTAALEFGATTVGTSRTLTKAIQNIGTADLIVSSVSVSGNPDFSVDPTTPATPFTVAPNATRNVVVRYTPSAAGDDTGQLSIGSNDADEATVAITLHGTGTAPALICDIDVTPLNWAAGAVQVGQTASQTFTIGNTGTGPCSVTAVTTSLAEFALGTLPARPFTVQPGANVQFQVTYAPVNSGTDNGSLQVRSSDPDEATVTIPLSGTGNVPTSCNIQVSAMALNFGGVPLGSSASRSTTFTNTGNANCTVNSVSLTSSTSPEFTFGAALPTLPLTLMPGEGLQVSLTYTPADQGDDTGALAVTSSDPDQPSVNVNLTGSGVQVTQQCDVQVSPLSLEFGDVAAGLNRVLSTTVTNAGQAPCNVSWQLAAGSSADFAFVDAPPSTPVAVAPGGSQAVSVRYSPSDSGEDTGSLQIMSDDPSEPEVPVALSGGGFTATGSVDLEVTRFDVTRRVQVGEAISIRVGLRNDGDTDQPRNATVIGVQNGVQVYNQTQPVSAPLTRGRRSSANFPSYTPTRGGTIQWTLEIEDEVSAGSTATATTAVRGSRGDSDHSDRGVVGGNSEHDDEEQEVDN